MNKLAALFGTAVVALSSQVMASPLDATNITVFDGQGSGSGWYGTQEDNEVEPHNGYGQKWDLEGFFQKGNNVSIVSGYNLKNGEKQGRHHWTSGDIFIDINNDVTRGSRTWSNGNKTVKNTYGFDYVLDVNWSNLTYDIVKLDANSYTKTSYFKNNQAANPWLYAGGGDVIGNGAFSLSSLTDAESGFLGGKHYYANGFDLSFLGENANFNLHFTMQCGNDDLRGKGKTPTTPVPVPSVAALMGIGLLALGRARRRKK